MRSSSSNQCGQTHNEDLNRYLFAFLTAMTLQHPRDTRLNNRYLINIMPRFLPRHFFGLQSTKANLERQRKTNAKSAREQRQALQMTYQVRV